jgi:phosphotransferase system enzyme I (PtsI)
VADASKVGEKILRGIPVSRGVCRGKLFLFRRAALTAVPRYTIEEVDFAEQTERLERAIVRTREQILGIQQRVQQKLGAEDAAIFDAQLLVLDDPVLLEEVVKHMRGDRVNVEQAFAVVAERYLGAFGAIDDEYLRERVADMRDATERMLHNLLSRDPPADLSALTEPCILVAEDLTPSQTALLDRRTILGFATAQGSRTSHTAILARSLQLPALTGLQDAIDQLRTGQYALLDGFNGLLVTQPTEQTLFEYGQLAQRHLALEARLQDMRDQPAVTLDGQRITLSANIENPDEVEDVRRSGAEGVGLFRTEYLFLNSDGPPSEEKQYEAYRRVAVSLHPNPVIIRTMDLGGDKLPDRRFAVPEKNPFMGLRAIRYCLQQPEMFRTQLRAILRASAVGNVKVMYPMISGLDELAQATALLEECQASLRAAGVVFDERLEVGVMVELPAAVLIADSLARRTRFFSIGTNDLIQYTLAVDRMNPRIAHLYEPTHPAVVRLVKQAIDAAHAHGLWAGICGEMASDPVMVPLLLGLGADELSTAPSLLPAVKFVTRRLKLSEARELAEYALGCEDGGAIQERAQALTQAIAPGLFAAEPSGRNLS